MRGRAAAHGTTGAFPGSVRRLGTVGSVTGRTAVPRLRSTIVLMAVLLLPGCDGDSAASRERTADQIAVLTAVERFFETMTDKDAIGARAVLDPEGDFVSVRWTDAGEAVVRRTSNRDYLQSLPGETATNLERVWDSDVRIHGPIAVVWTPYDFHIDGTFSHCGMDVFNLLRTDEGWVITGGMYTVERAGCAPSPLGPPASSPARVTVPQGRNPDSASALDPLVAPVAEPEPAGADTVGVLLARRLDDPERVTIENFYLYLPPGFGEEDREWPVLFYLHGRSLRGDDLTLVKKYGIPSRIERGHHMPFIVVAPQLPAGQRWMDTDRMWELLEEAVLDRYPVDGDRIYATGYSMGGGGAWRFARAHADELAAAVPVSATTPVPSELWAKSLAALPVRVIHGDADVDAPFGPALSMVDYLRERGVPVELIAIEGGTHNIVEQVYGDPALYEWLLSHAR